jgi:HK97 family phage major capsid protein
MEPIQLLKDRVEDKKALLEVTEDEAKQKELTSEILDLEREIGKEEAKAEFEAKQAEKESAERKAAQTQTETAKQTGAQRVEVKESDEYKGYKLKAEVASLQGYAGLNENVRKRFIERPDIAEKMATMWIDMIEKAMAGGPQRVANIKASMQEDTDSEGGYLVFPEYRNEVLSYIREESVALQDARVVPMASDVAYYPRENSTVSVTITDEENDATASNPTFEQVTLTAKRHDAYATASNELLNDQSIPGGIVAILMSQFNEAVGQKIDSATFIGSGDPVSGVFLSAGYSVVFGSGSSAFSELLESDIREVISKIPTSRLAGAKFYCHRSPAWTYLYGLKDGDDRPLFIPSTTRENPHQVYGYPLRLPEKAPSSSAADTGFIVFGNLRGFMIGERLGNIEMIVDPYTLGKSYQTNFYIFTRWAYAHGLPNNYARIVTAS